MNPAQTTFTRGQPAAHHPEHGQCPGRRRFLRNGLALAAIPLIGVTEAGAQAWPAAIPGGLAVLDLGPARVAPIARFNDERVLVSGKRNRWLALIGIPLDSKPGRSPPVTIDRGSGKSASVCFTISDKRYESENLLIKSDWVDLSETELARCDAEREHLEEVLGHYSESAPASLLLAAPCKGNPSSTFGLVRSFNGQPRNPHTGMDIAAPIDTPVVSAGYGHVADIGDYFLLGRTVTVDHGRGLMTLYAHLNEIEVNPRKRIKPGQRLGRVGVTGRVTGPHLHFAVYLNATAVNPLFFLPGGYRSVPRLAVIQI